MPMIRLRKSRLGRAFAGAFLGAALALFALHVASVKTNPADSASAGENRRASRPRESARADAEGS